MPWVRLERFAGPKVTLTKSDRSFRRGTGYIIRKHWAAWVWYLVMVTAWTVAAFGSIVALRSTGLLAPLPSTSAITALAAAITGVGLFTVIRYREIANEYLLLTPNTVFHSEIQHWTVRVVDPIGVEAINGLDTDEQSALLPGVRVVKINTAGDRPDKVMTMAAGGDEIANAWQRLRDHRKH